MSIEKAVFVDSPDTIDSCALGVKRIYFGNEFCHRLLPSPEEVEQFADKAAAASMALTLVTPFVTDDELETVKKAIKAFHLFVPDGEVVFSDWGVLRVLKETYPSLTPVLGRLLNKQTIDPRIGSMIDEFQEKSREHFLSAAADNPEVTAFLVKMGVNRIEFENTFQGFVRQGTMPASLHYPYILFSLTRLCPSANLGAGRGFRGIGSCQRECCDTRYKISWKGVPLQALSFGKVQLVANFQYPPDVESLGIDRIVNHVRTS